jgi:tetratricopeptide (TPR) repeat protein
VALDVAGDYDRALAWTDDLLADYPTESWDYYRTKAYILRYMGRSEESLAVYDQAIEVFPDEWWAYSHKCYYTALLTGDPIEVMDACDRSIELGPTWPSVAYDRRAIARALIGDLTGAEEDMARGLELASADDPSMARDAVLETRPVWLAELRAGRNPIGEEEIEFELARH